MNPYLVEQRGRERRHELLREAEERALLRAVEHQRQNDMSPLVATPMTPFALIVLWFVGLNALAGAASLLLAPTASATLFFWPITPPLNAALFGALYLGGGVAVCLLAWRGDWEPARALMPVLVSAGLLITGVTLAHLERFTPGPRLVYWLLVYAGAPLLAVVVYVVQERRGAVWNVRAPLRPVTRTVAAGSGGLLLGAGLLVLVRPEALVALWPWPITTLMLRVFAAWFAGIGAGLLWFLVDDDWSRLALLPRLLIAAAALDLAVLLAHRGDLMTHRPRLWLYGAHLLGLAALGILLHWLQRQSQPAASRYTATLSESPSRRGGASSLSRTLLRRWARPSK